MDEKGRFSGEAEKKLEEVSYAFLLLYEIMFLESNEFPIFHV